MPQKRNGRVYIGTSGWMYKDWGERFYPKGLKQGHLSFLAGEFNTVEVNTSFYHLPRKSTFKKWAFETPAEFVFAVKLSRYITHEKRLHGIRAPLERFIQRASPLKGKLGVILVQLPPWLSFRKELVERFLGDLAAITKRNYPVRFALEPRHESWTEERNAAEAAGLLRPAKVALVFAHSSKIPSYSPKEKYITADFVYVRFHGPSEFAASEYGPSRLRPWAQRIAAWCGRGRDAYIYFNNDVHGHAVDDARTLKRQLAKL